MRVSLGSVPVDHLEPGYERVYTVTEYYDGPRRGLANYRNVPHVFACEWSSDQDEYADTFLLAPVTPELFVAALEDWEIWLRYERAYREGRASLDMHPALPEDRERHLVLAEQLEGKLIPDPAVAFRRAGEFKPLRPHSGSPSLGLVPLQVRWSEPHAA